MPLIFNNTWEVRVLLDVFLPLLSVACNPEVHSHACLHAFLKASSPSYQSFSSFIRKDVELAVHPCSNEGKLCLGLHQQESSKQIRGCHYFPLLLLGHTWNIVSHLCSPSSRETLGNWRKSSRGPPKHLEGWRTLCMKKERLKELDFFFFFNLGKRRLRAI